MSKKATIITLVVLAVAALLYFKVVRKDDMGGTGAPAGGGAGLGGSGGGSGVTYKCEGNKMFTLSYVDADTVRLSGSGITSTNLNKTAVGYYLNADGKTVVKQAGNWVVLVQNDLVTHDKCVAQ